MVRRAKTLVFLALLCTPALSQTRQGVTVLFFLRSDCPVSNLYAPEIQRIAHEFAGKVQFTLVFPDVSDSPQNVAKDVAEYYPQSALRETVQRDPVHELVRRTRVTMMPEAAVLAKGQLIYSGRIDDRVTGLGQSRAQANTHDLENAIHAALDGKPAQPAAGPAYGCYIADAQ